MIYIILANGFEEIEAIAPCDILRRGGAEVCFAAVGRSKNVEGAHAISVLADVLADEITVSENDIFVIPGGMGGVNSIKASQSTMALIKTSAELGNPVAAICAGPSVLSELGITDGKHITCYPGCEDIMGSAKCSSNLSTARDGKIITGRAPGSAIDFGLELLAFVKGEPAAKKVSSELVCSRG